MSQNRCRAILRNSAAYAAFASVFAMGTASAEEVNNGTDPAGLVVGKALGGNAVVYFEPQVFAGADRPADWGFQVGYKIIGF